MLWTRIMKTGISVSQAALWRSRFKFFCFRQWHAVHAVLCSTFPLHLAFAFSFVADVKLVCGGPELTCPLKSLGHNDKMSFGQGFALALPPMSGWCVVGRFAFSFLLVFAFSFARSFAFSFAPQSSVRLPVELRRYPHPSILGHSFFPSFGKPALLHFHKQPAYHLVFAQMLNWNFVNCRENFVKCPLDQIRNIENALTVGFCLATNW